MTIPHYLLGFAKNVKQSGTKTSLDLSCPCGCSQFLTYKNKPNKEDEEVNDKWEELINGRFDRGNVSMVSDAEGNVFLVKKNFFGKTIDKVRVNNMPHVPETNVLKAKCNNCDEEFILFDNRVHGYDAFVSEVKKDLFDVEFIQIKFKGSTNDVVKLSMRIFNDISFEEFNSDDVHATLEEYSGAFSDITIYGFIIDMDNKKVTIYSEETA